MINAREREHFYRSQKLETEHGFDQPGTVYPAHRHERTILYTIFGSLDIVIEEVGEIKLLPGDEFEIQSGQEHSAMLVKMAGNI